MLSSPSLLVKIANKAKRCPKVCVWGRMASINPHLVNKSRNGTREVGCKQKVMWFQVMSLFLGPRTRATRNKKIKKINGQFPKFRKYNIQVLQNHLKAAFLLLCHLNDLPLLLVQGLRRSTSIPHNQRISESALQNIGLFLHF